MSYDTNTRLLFLFNEQVGGTSLADSSTYEKSALCNSTAKIMPLGRFDATSVGTGNAKLPFDASLGSYPPLDPAAFVSVNNPSSITFGTPYEAKQFDFWFYPLDYGERNLLYLEFSDGRSFALSHNSGNLLLRWYKPSPATTLEATGYSYGYTGRWMHFRVLIKDKYMAVGVDGYMSANTYGSLTLWPTATGWPPIPAELTKFNIGGKATNGAARGLFDDFVLTTGAVSWDGYADYTPPSAVPDIPAPPVQETNLYGSSVVENTITEQVILILPVITATGSSAVDSTTTVSEAVHCDITISTTTFVDDVAGEGLLIKGPVSFFSSISSVDAIQGECSAETRPISTGEGAASTESVSSYGICTTSFVVMDPEENIVSVSSYGAIKDSEHYIMKCYGTSYVSMQSSGVFINGAMPIEGTGNCVVKVDSYGEAGVACSLRGEAFLDDVTSKAEASGAFAVACESRIDDISSFGQALIYTKCSGNNRVDDIKIAAVYEVLSVAQGAAEVLTSSFGTASVTISGKGENKTHDVIGGIKSRPSQSFFAFNRDRCETVSVKPQSFTVRAN